jgi:two-component system sensor histidine kinase/response regulator
MAELQQKNDELAQSRQFLESVLENLHSLVYTKDVQGRYTYMNSEWERMLERDRSASLGMTDIGLFPTESAKRAGKRRERLQSRSL